MIVLDANVLSELLRPLPDARLVAMPGIGHVPMEETPAEVVRVLREFLGGKSPGD